MKRVFDISCAKPLVRRQTPAELFCGGGTKLLFILSDDWAKGGGSDMRKAQRERLSELAYAAVRQAVASKCGVSPKDVKIVLGGKPYAAIGCKFNISHADGLAVCAFSDDEVGVDVEAVTGRNFEGIARRHFDKTECEAALASPEGFYGVWTAKESAVKFGGGGLKDLGGARLLFEYGIPCAAHIGGAYLPICMLDIDCCDVRYKAAVCGGGAEGLEYAVIGESEFAKLYGIAAF